MINIVGYSNFVEIHAQGHSIVAMYAGSHLVWEQIRSCYGRGRWIPDKPWLDNDTWKNE